MIVLPVRAWLTVGARTREIARWWSATAARRDRDRPEASARLAVASELVAADAVTAPGRSLELADVIYSGSFRSRDWPSVTLERYPSSAVVAVRARDGGYVVAARVGHPCDLVYFGRTS